MLFCLEENLILSDLWTGCCCAPSNLASTLARQTIEPPAARVTCANCCRPRVTEMTILHVTQLGVPPKWVVLLQTL